MAPVHIGELLRFSAASGAYRGHDCRSRTPRTARRSAQSFGSPSTSAGHRGRRRGARGERQACSQARGREAHPLHQVGSLPAVRSGAARDLDRRRPGDPPPMGGAASIVTAGRTRGGSDRAAGSGAVPMPMVSAHLKHPLSPPDRAPGVIVAADGGARTVELWASQGGSAADVCSTASTSPVPFGGDVRGRVMSRLRGVAGLARQ